MTAWGWADSARARSTAGLESAPRVRPLPASVAVAVAVEEALARAPVRAASAAAAEAVVVEAAASVVAVAGAAAEWARTPMDGDREDAADAVRSTDNSPASATVGALRLRCPGRCRSRCATRH